ncbi:MAG: 50S ribosomal protein L29 [Candidatus Micrarchaeota archaeon]
MAVVRKNDLKAMETEALKAKLAEIEASAAAEYGALKNATRGKSIRYRELRKARARIKTILNQRGIKL